MFQIQETSVDEKIGREGNGVTKISDKKCNGFCKQIKPIVCFYSKGRSWDSYCKDCRKKMKKEQVRAKKKDIVFEVVSIGECDRRFLAKGFADLIMSIVRGNEQVNE